MSDPIADLTWPALLAKWTEFAQASVAFPKSGDGVRWRASVPAVIGLQAVTLALAEIGTLGAGERAVGIARAAGVIEKHQRELAALWGKDLSGELAVLLDDSTRALEAARAGSLG